MNELTSQALQLMVLSALAYRLRGMGIKVDGTPQQTGLYGSREIVLFFCGLTAGLALMTVLDFSLHITGWQTQVAVALTVLVTSVLDCLPHSKGMIFGSKTGTTFAAFLVLLETGMASGAATVLALVWFHQYALAAGALLTFAAKPLAYFIGWKIPSQLSQLETGAPLGELLTGLSRLSWMLLVPYV